MNRLVYFIAITIVLSSCTEKNSIEVRTISTMKKVMMGQDLSMNVLWDTIPKENLYALAPLGRIQGELTIVNGTIYTSEVDSNNTIVIQNNWDVNSPFAVYANVAEWLSFETVEKIENERELQALIENIAGKNGYDLNTAFPFRVLGDFSSIDFHIISKPIDEKENSHELHNKAKKHFLLKNTNAELVGFYSRNHEGVFTHKGHYIHTHIIDENKTNMGHLENLSTENKIKILLPKY